MLSVDEVAEVLAVDGAGGSYEQTRRELKEGRIIPGLRKLDGVWRVPITALAEAMDRMVEVEPITLPASRGRTQPPGPTVRSRACVCLRITRPTARRAEGTNRELPSDRGDDVHRVAGYRFVGPCPFAPPRQGRSSGSLAACTVVAANAGVLGTRRLTSACARPRRPDAEQRRSSDTQILKAIQFVWLIESRSLYADKRAPTSSWMAMTRPSSDTKPGSLPRKALGS